MQSCFLAVSLTLLGIIFSFVSSTQAQQRVGLPGLAKDGRVRLSVYHTGETFEIHYLDNQGAWLPGADETLSRLLRSRGDEQQHVIDRRLIELADHLQDHFEADTVEVISGFRSPDFNRELKESGHNVANESFHTKGLAMDIHLDEIDEATLRDYLLSLQLGGVGYYGNKLMVHMDFGPVRRWQDGGFVQNTGIGIFNKLNPAHLRTSKLFYTLGETMTLTASPDVPNKVLLQKYFRGTWVTAKTVNFSATPAKPFSKSLTLDDAFLKADRDLTSLFGKYRFRWERGADWQQSNEFYVKKR